MVSMPRVHDCYGYLLALGKLEKPERNFALVSTGFRGSFRGAPGV